MLAEHFVAKKDDQRPIVIKKVKKGGGGGHHGGAWKVAYADFVTAMMAFFMLLWLLNVSDKETLEGLADYFSPSSASVSGTSGSGKPLAGTVIGSQGALDASSSITQIQGPPPSAQTDADDQSQAEDSSETPKADFADKLQDGAMNALEETLRQAIQDSPELAQHKDQVLIEQTPEGVRIQITDKDGRSMFRDSTADLFGYAQRLIREIGAIVSTLPNRIAIMGHTDGGTYGAGSDYTNWELSADRANSARRVLSRTGVSSDRFSEVTGKAATEPLYPTDTFRAENRRITILVLREAPVVSPRASGGR
ncbi:chemotaxis protein MotB [Iodidimonas muriae]|uniref:Chemotaxis protein MotB n=1 Tax=Iodidimonas muriae TaxID=261467 RepID=A0ABQ2LEY8_9PROT|nr:chemotaxis protein MotB [Kordiimonadales bacterium JCM 17843]GGO14516.1 chemotaxis protein MotB [Iodidimonas muriae]